MTQAERGIRTAGRPGVRVVAVLTLKGGVGKTTLTSHVTPHLVAELRRRRARARVLVVDADTQSGATVTFTGFDPSRLTATLATVLAGRHDLRDTVIALDDHADIDDVIAHARVGTDLLPSNELSKVQVKAVEDFWALRELLHDSESLPPHTEFVIIDCGYGDTDLTELAMVASDEVVAVLTPNALDVNGLNLLLRKIGRMRPTFPHLELAGVVVNQLTDYLADEEVLNDLVEQLGPRLWTPHIPFRAAIRRANNQHLPMSAYHPQRPELINLFASLATTMLNPRRRPGRHRRTH